MPDTSENDLNKIKSYFPHTSDANSKNLNKNMSRMNQNLELDLKDVPQSLTTSRSNLNLEYMNNNYKNVADINEELNRKTVTKMINEDVPNIVQKFSSIKQKTSEINLNQESNQVGRHCSSEEKKNMLANKVKFLEIL